MPLIRSLSLDLSWKAGRIRARDSPTRILTRYMCFYRAPQAIHGDSKKKAYGPSPGRLLSQVSSDVFMDSPRPSVDASLAARLIKKLFPTVDGEHVHVLGEFPSYDDRNFHVMLRLIGERLPKEYVLKIYHEKHSDNVAYLEACTELAVRISEAGIPCPTPLASRKGTYFCLEELEHPFHERRLTHAIRLLKYIPGTMMASLGRPSKALLADVGGCIADIRKCFEAFQGTETEAVIKAHQPEWSSIRVLEFDSLVRCIPDEPVRGMVQTVLDRFRQEIQPRLANMNCGIVHSDINVHNILINPSQPDKVSGVLDISDIHYAPVVVDLGISLAYICLMFPESPAESTAPIVRGYLAKGSLDTLDRETLHLWVLTRLSQTIFFGYNAYEKDPGNEYLLCSARPACAVLPKLFAMTPADVERVWFL